MFGSSSFGDSTSETSSAILTANLYNPILSITGLSMYKLVDAAGLV